MHRHTREKKNGQRERERKERWSENKRVDGVDEKGLIHFLFQSVSNMAHSAAFNNEFFSLSPVTTFHPLRNRNSITLAFTSTNVSAAVAPYWFFFFWFLQGNSGHRHTTQFHQRTKNNNNNKTYYCVGREKINKSTEQSKEDKVKSFSDLQLRFTQLLSSLSPLTPQQQKERRHRRKSDASHSLSLYSLLPFYTPGNFVFLFLRHHKF